LTYSGWFTHISGHPSATGRAQDSESTPAKDRCSTAGPRNQRTVYWRNLVNMTEPFVGGGDAALCQIALSTCCYVRCARMSCCCADIELVYNAVIALVMVQPFHSGEMLISVLCEKLTGQPGDKQSPLRLRLSVSCLYTLPLC